MNTVLLFAKVAPWIEISGLIGAIVIAVFLFVLVLLTLAFHLAMMFGLGWVREKAELIKKLRPYVDHLVALRKVKDEDGAISPDEPVLIRAAASLPSQTKKVEGKVDEAARQVASQSIEIRARTEQVKGVLKALFLPGRARREQLERRQREENRKLELPREQHTPVRTDQVRKLIEDGGSA